MNRRYLVTTIVLVVLVAAAASSYRVGEAEQAIVTQFGDPIGDPIVTPGLHFKVPFVQQVNYFDKRFLKWEGSRNQVPTKDKRFIWVDTYARWRIVDPLRFFQRLRDERGAQSRLDDILDGETRNAVARYNLIELVRNSNRNPEDIPIEAEEEEVILNVIEKGRDQVSREILERAAGRTADLGIELLDLRIKRINYVEEVQKDVFARMIAERQRIAELYRSQGQGEAARIEGERERDLQRIQSEAFKTAEELRGKADAEATDIYADAYSRDADFYAFTRSLETYEKVIPPAIAKAEHPLERLCLAIGAYCRVVDRLRDATVLTYRSTKSLRADRRSFIKEGETRTNRLLEACLRACIAAGHVRPINDSLLVYQYVLFAHAWALKQWAHRGCYSLEDYVEEGIKLLVEPFLTEKGRAAMARLKRKRRVS